MCGYIRRVTDSPYVAAILDQIGLEGFSLQSEADIDHFYPAFGGDANRQIKGLIIEEEGQYKFVDATWWFDCQEAGEQLIVGKRTTFNARNLDSPFWKGAINKRRAVVVATGLGESKMIDGKKHQYLMEGEAFLLGAVYRKFDNGKYACAVITRDSHPRFEQYHDKAFPLFLPHEPGFIESWLSPEMNQPVADLLDAPKIFADLRVQQVKAFKSGTVDSFAEVLEAD